jgi:hypothetical protein
MVAAPPTASLDLANCTNKAISQGANQPRWRNQAIQVSLRTCVVLGRYTQSALERRSVRQSNERKNVIESTAAIKSRTSRVYWKWNCNYMCALH